MGGIVMKSEYIQPVIEILLFDEDEILTASAVTPNGVTANEDVLAQMDYVLGGSGKSSSITSVRLEDIGVIGGSSSSSSN
jgi:hypothetical protein